MTITETCRLEALALQIAGIAQRQDYSTRIEMSDLGRLAGIGTALNSLLDSIAKREKELSAQRDELQNAWENAETANKLLRHLKDELKARQKQLDDAVSKAASASTAKSQFLANMSHEIRTPMNGILGTAELLNRTQLEDKQRKYVETILRSGRSLLTIINDILDFSKVESGKIDIDRKPFDLYMCVKDVVALLQPTCAEKKISIEVDFAPPVKGLKSLTPEN